MNLLCFIKHKWEYYTVWYPSFEALVVVRVESHKKCVRCKKDVIYDTLSFV
jgi:hypothetical protein